MLKIPIWKPKKENFSDNPSILVYGSRRSGKSYLVRHLYKEYFKHSIDLTFVYSLSPRTCDFYRDFVKQVNPIENPQIFCGEIPNAFLDKVDALNDARRKAKEKPLKILLIVDDGLSTKTKFNDMMTQCFIRGRHSELSIIFCTQNHSLLSQNWKQNADYQFVGKNSGAGRDFFYKSYLTEHKKDVAFKVLSECKDFWFLVLPLQDTNDKEDMYYYKAPNEEIKVKKNVLPKKSHNV